jgi:hypothetical protein
LKVTEKRPPETVHCGRLFVCLECTPTGKESIQSLHCWHGQVEIRRADILPVVRVVVLSAVVRGRIVVFACQPFESKRFSRRLELIDATQQLNHQRSVRRYSPRVAGNIDAVLKASSCLLDTVKRSRVTLTLFRRRPFASEDSFRRRSLYSLSALQLSLQSYYRVVLSHGPRFARSFLAALASAPESPERRERE